MNLFVPQRYLEISSTKKDYPYTTGTPGTPTKTYSYVYGDDNWKDKLTSYDGKAITYDAIGNPLTYDGWTYTWEAGRQLATMSKTGQSLSFKYNDSGIRTQKTVNGVTTKYYLSGDKVTLEDNGTDKIYYSYGVTGNLVSMNLNGTEYYYIRNAQGDIIGLFDNTGTQVVSYTYDSWGKLISTTGTLAGTVGAKNPYLYRGYRYDSETGLYYLQSRYYNPDWGRFINADAEGGQVGELLTHNVFAYCMNNPVNMADPNGDIAWWIVGGALGAIAGAAYSYATTGSVDWRYVAGGALVGAGLGFLASTVSASLATTVATSGAVSGQASQRVSSALTVYDPKFAAQQLVRNGKTTVDALRSMIPKGSVNQFRPTDTIKEGFKYNFKVNGTRMEIKWHSPDLNALAKYGPGSNSASGWTAQISVGNKFLGQNLGFYKRASNITHIPIFGR